MPKSISLNVPVKIYVPVSAGALIVYVNAVDFYE
jgi:hypothetical protein